MLSRLFIQNVAVIQKAAITLGPGLNVFTGETGAGKTILISAIDAVLGERAPRDMIRTGEEKALVSAFFENLSPEALRLLRELGYDEDEGGVLITRELSRDGKSSSKINGMPATAGVLRQVAGMLIHIHGQRDAAQLLLPERHMELIDSFGELSGSREQYAASYRRLREIETAIVSLTMDDKQKAQRVDMLTYQIAEIEATHLDDPGEEEELLARRKLINAGEKVMNALSSAYCALKGEDGKEGIDTLFGDLISGVETAAEYIPALAAMANRLADIGYEISDFAAELRDALDSLEFDPREQNDIESRLHTIHGLKRKYGEDIATILLFCEQARAELEGITTSGERLAVLEEERTVGLQEAVRLAEILTGRRVASAEAFIKEIEAELAFLDMPHVRLFCRREAKALGADGADDMSFYLSTNIGEDPKPLHKIASGGEISRMMLAIKNVLADRDAIGTLIFDEVDNGVSGRAAHKIGRKLAEVSRGRQVICVTHLAPVAAFADTHLLIHKEVEEGRTYTRVQELAHEARETELARITSGDNVTQTALENAREMIRTARNAIL